MVQTIGGFSQGIISVTIFLNLHKANPFRIISGKGWIFSDTENQQLPISYNCATDKLLCK